jgi:hypothetical protein
LPEQFAHDLLGVDIEAFVHVQEVDHAIDPVAETWLAAILADAGDSVPPAVCVGYADLALETWMTCWLDMPNTK